MTLRRICCESRQERTHSASGVELATDSAGSCGASSWTSMGAELSRVAGNLSFKPIFLRQSTRCQASRLNPNFHPSFSSQLLRVLGGSRWCSEPGVHLRLRLR